MPLFDLPLDRLRAHRSAVTPPDDLAEFWADTLADTRRYDLDLRLVPEDAGLTVFDVHDVTFNGFGGAPIKGWYLRPRGAAGPLPCVVEFVGYGGGRGLPAEWLIWPAAGYGQLVMDIRGQGSEWRSGDTADPWPGNGPHAGGFLTLGIEHRDDYYYRRVFADAVRAVEAARALPGVDPASIVVAGASQGGGIALAVAGLVPDLAAAVVDIPFLCDILRATELVETDRTRKSPPTCAPTGIGWSRPSRRSGISTARCSAARPPHPRCSRSASWTTPAHRQRFSRRSMPTAGLPRCVSTPTTNTTAAGSITAGCSSPSSTRCSPRREPSACRRR